MKTSHRESETGHTAAILEEIPGMFCDGLRCILKLKIAGKTLISSQRVAGPRVPALHTQTGNNPPMPCPSGERYMAITANRLFAVQRHLVWNLCKSTETVSCYTLLKTLVVVVDPDLSVNRQGMLPHPSLHTHRE